MIKAKPRNKRCRIIGIVKMFFREDETETFKSLLKERTLLIANFEGCQQLDLCQDKIYPQIIFTYSWRVLQQHVDNYRASAFHFETWTHTKQKFAARQETKTVDCRYRTGSPRRLPLGGWPSHT